MRQMRRLLVGLFGLSMLACAPVSAFGQKAAGQGCRIPGFPAPVLCARAGLDAVPASYLVLVDESGSMTPIWSAVQKALVDLVGAIADGDELDARLFSGSVRGLIAAGAATPQSRAAWTSRFRGLGRPAGTHTDLGRAAESALSTLSAAPADRLQFVFFLTDGKHEPTAGSPYPSAASCNQLTAQARRILDPRPVSVAAIRLSTEADVSFLQCVFPSAVVTDAIGPKALSDWFVRRLREVWVEKLRLRINHDLRRPAAVIAPAEPITARALRTVRAQVEIGAERRLVETVLAAGTTIPLGAGSNLILTDTVTLSPGAAPKSWPTDITASSCAAWRWPGSCRERVSATQSVRTQLEPSKELRLIGLDDQRDDSVQVGLDVAAGGALGWPLWLLTASVLLVCIGYLGLLTKWTVHRPRLLGRVISRFGGPDGQVLDLGRHPDRRIAIRDPRGREILYFEARSRRGRTLIYAIPGSVAVDLNGRRFATEAVISGLKVFKVEDGEISYIP